MNARPLLALVMIVKDEAQGLTPTLASVRPHIDRWLILDTGSTDGTQDEIRRVLGGIPGELREEPFVDFATTRNRALDLAEDQAEWLLLLDADDTLEGGSDLRAFLESEPAGDAFLVRAEKPGCAWSSARVVRASAGWRYVGTVHEVLTRDGQPPPTEKIPGVVIRHRPGPTSEERTRARWRRDRALLEQEAAEHPERARASFYLALTCHWLGDLEAAAAWFRHRIEMGGWREEIFESFLRLGHIRRQLGQPVNEVADAYLAAHEIMPHRAEPFVYLAALYRIGGRPHVADLFSSRATGLPYPENDMLFIDTACYPAASEDTHGSRTFP